MKSTISFVFFLLLFTLHAASAEPTEFEAIRKKIQAKLIQQQIPSLAVAVARDGKIIWEEGFGWADRENRVPATQHMMYSLASISKPITATGLMILAERGKVSLDKPVNPYLGDAKVVAHVGNVDEATLRRLANHSSGLPLHYQFFYADEPYRRPSMDESIRRYGHLMTKPGERYQYANFGYGILDYVIQRTSAVSYAEFMRREVFLPLGMTHTSVDIGHGLEKHQAIRYAPNQAPLPFYDIDHPGASAVFSSAHDLVRFGMFHLKNHLDDQKAILTDKSIEEMHRPTFDSGGGRSYGVGWSINPNELGQHTLSHSGGMGGVRTRLTLLPKKNIAIVALCNFSSNLPMEITRDIITKLTDGQEKTTDSAKSTPSDDNPTGHWTGQVETYRGNRGIEMWFQPSGDIHVRLDNQLIALVNQPKFESGALRGVFVGNIGTPDANRRPYHLHLDLKLRGEVLNGALCAISLPGPRAGNALSYWVEVRKKN